MARPNQIMLAHEINKVISDYWRAEYHKGKVEGAKQVSRILKDEIESLDSGREKLEETRRYLEDTFAHIPLEREEIRQKLRLAYNSINKSLEVLPDLDNIKRRIDYFEEQKGKTKPLESSWYNHSEDKIDPKEFRNLLVRHNLLPPPKKK